MSCNECNLNNTCCDPCGKRECGCGDCPPAKYDCDFQIFANPYDPSIWNVSIGGATTKVKIPKINETNTTLAVNTSADTLIYTSEKGQNIITGDQLGSIIDLNDLQDVEAPNPDSCDILVFDPGCSDCGDGCKPKPAMWRNYHIPDGDDCEMELDDDGYYRVLTKDDCGCIVECRMPVIPNGMTTLDYQRDSVPDDPDFPWYYGNYNDHINLHLAENAAEFFGKYALKVTVNYGVQAIVSDNCKNVNWRSIVVPVVNGETIRTTTSASILQNWAMFVPSSLDSVLSTSREGIPWGSSSLRGSITFIVPKGKEAYLHHEYRLRTNGSFPNYYTTPRDGQKVPDSELGLDTILYPASRLNALQVIIEPTRGVSNYEPVKDAERSQLDAPVDSYPNPYD